MNKINRELRFTSSDVWRLLPRGNKTAGETACSLRAENKQNEQTNLIQQTEIHINSSKQMHQLTDKGLEALRKVGVEV